MKQLKFEWYVVNENFNKNKIEMFNIFNNWKVNEHTNKLCVDYKKKHMSFEEFTEELKQIIKWQEWSRCEYEVCVAGWPPTYLDKDGKRICHYNNNENEPIYDVKMEKIDCYWQCVPNMKIIAKYVLEEYYPRLKINLHTEVEEDG